MWGISAVFGGTTRAPVARMHVILGSVPVSRYMTYGPFVVGPREPISNATRLMKEFEIRHLPVCVDGKLVGVVSDRDVDLVQVRLAKGASDIVVEDAMTGDPYAPSPETPLADVVRTMAERRLGSAIILEGGRVAGVFTRADALRALVDALEAA